MGTCHFASMAIVDGNPAIAYQSTGTTADLYYVRAAVADGSAWGAPFCAELAVFANAVGIRPQLAIISGNPAICYQADLPPNRPCFVRSNDTTGNVGWSPGVPLDNSDPCDSGLFSSMAEVDGIVYVAYYDALNVCLMCVRSTDATGSAWDTPKVVDSGWNVGSYCSIANINGHPAIAYYNADREALQYAVMY